MLMTTDFTGLQFTDINNGDKSGTLNHDLCLLDTANGSDAAGGSDDDDDNVCVRHDDLLSESEIIPGRGSVTIASLFDDDDLDVGCFGPDDICFYGEVGCWQDSGVKSQMVNAVETIRRSGGIEETDADDMSEFQEKHKFDNNAITLEVPEEYDKLQDNEKEEKVFGKVLQFPTARRPLNYRRELKDKSEAAEAAAWFATRKITMGERLTKEEKEEAILLLYTWKDAFANELKDMPVTDLVEHQIPVWPGAQPRRAKDKVYTKEEQDWIELNIPKLERAGIIGRSESPWSHRTKFVRKKDGGLRMVHVFCPINEATMVSSYPMKRIEPVINNLMQARFSIYFQADAANGFWAVRMNPAHAYRTAFATYNGQWQYLRMGQGLAGAPLTYARLKDIFSGAIPAPNPEPCLNRCSKGAFECFVDDDFGAHEDFRSLFNFLHSYYFPRLIWARITLKESKSGFFLEKIHPLGYASDGSGLRPSLDKVKAIRDYPRPTNLAEIEAFLYMTIFLRQFIPGRVEYARLMKKAIQYRVESADTMNRTLVSSGKRVRSKKSECGIKWRQEQETAFEAIKKAIIENVVYGGDETRQYHLMTDASTHAIGGVLFQLPNTPAGINISPTTRKDMKVVMFISKRLAPAETRYSTTEREALAILRCLEEVRWLILGSPFPTKIYTDHQALLGLLRKDDAHGRIVRWQIRLAEYDVEYIHKPGRENVIADGLSRMHYSGDSQARSRDGLKEVAAVEEEEVIKNWSEWLEDEWYGAIAHYKLFGDLEGFRDENGEPLTTHKRRLVRRNSTKYRLIDQPTAETQEPEQEGITVKLPRRLVYVERNGKEAFCVRRKQVPAILHYLHDCHGHFAAGILSRTLIGRYYWPTRGKDVHGYCTTCPSCQLIGPLKPSVSQMSIVHLQPFDMMGFDFVGRFPDTPRGNKYIVIGVDYFTRFMFALPVADSQGKSAVALLMRTVKLFGWPRAVYTDNGAHFVSGEFAKTLKDFHVVHLPAPKSHPQSVGLAERYVRLLVDGLKVTVMASKAPTTDWDLYVDPVVHSINTRVLSVHGFSPAELLLGYNPNRIGWDTSPATERAVSVIAKASTNNPADGSLWTKDQDLAARQFERVTKIEERRAEAAEKIVEQAEEKMSRQKEVRFQAPGEGDLVLLRRFLLDQRRGNKLEPRWEGPYRLGDLAWHGKTGRLYDINTRELMRVKKGGLKDRVHLNDLKLYLTRRTEEMNLVTLLEYGNGDEAWEHAGEVYDLQDGLRACTDDGTHVYWWDEAEGVG